MSEPPARSEPQREPSSPEALRASEQAYRSLVEMSHDLIWSVDAQGRWTFVNAASRAIYGYEPAEMLGRTFMEFETPEQAEKDLEVFARIKAGTPAFNYETVHLRKDGTPVHLSFNAVFVRDEHGAVRGTTGTAQDITERKRAEEALRSSERELRLIANTVPGPISRVGRDLRYRFVNDHYERVFGKPRSAVVGHRMPEVIGPELFRHVEPYVQRALAGERVTLESQTRAPDGGLTHWFVTFVPDLNDARQIEGFFVVALDITERKQAEAELRWRTAFFEAQVDSALDGILVVDAQGRKILQNQRLNELWKIPRQIAESKDDAEQVRFATNQTRNPREFAEKVAHLYSRPDEVSRDEIELVDGTILERVSSPVRDKAGKHYGRIWTFRDITERRKLEEQLRQSQRMDSIGQLAGGVAHDFNNILTVIQGHIALLEAQEAALPAVRESIVEIKQAAERAANLTRQLLTFSRRQSMRTSHLDLNTVVTNMARMLQRILGEDIRMDLHLSPSEVGVLADTGMVEQVLLNLAVNSRDAMPRGGRLLIETSAVDFDDTITARMPSARAGAFVCLAATDTGTGIPAHVLPHIFEPFFTTKELGKGTGLGLATIYGIVQQHEGWIVVESEPGRGTTFCVYLPRQSGVSVPAAPAEASPPRGGHETILVVEDEPSLRALVGNLLGRQGYRVFAAATGPQALELWRAHPDQIQLLLTDLVMPDGLSGFDLGLQLAREAPGLRVVYTSGYSPEIAGRGEALIPGVNFLPKPFEIDALLHVIRAALDGAKA